MNTVIINGINITKEYEELKKDVARYFELLNKLYFQGETFTDDNNDEFAKLTQKLSRVGKE